MALSSPNYTQTPNEVFALMPLMKDAELRVTLVIVRATFGWQQGGSAAVLSLSDIQVQSGLSRQGVLNGLKEGRARGTIYQVKSAGFGKAAYGLVVNHVDQSTPLTSPPSRPEVVNVVDRSTSLTSPPSRPGVVNEVDQGSQRSRPEVVNVVDRSTPLAAAPSAEKTDPERKERKQRKKEKENNTQKSAADAAVCAPESEGFEALKEELPNGEGLPLPSQVSPVAGQGGEGNITALEGVPPPAAEPAPPAPRQPSAALARLMAAWNDNRGGLPRVDTANDGRELAAKKLLKDFGSLDAAVAAVEDATRQAATDDWWRERNYPFDVLVPAKVARRAETWRARRQPPAPLAPGTAPPADEPFDLDAALRGASLNGTTRRTP